MEHNQRLWENARFFSDKMLERRGYRKQCIHVDENENDTLSSSQLSVYVKESAPSILVWYFNIDKLNIDYIKEFIAILETRQYRHGIIIYQNYITSSTKKVLENLYKFTIELFIVKDFQYDITQFKYYCVHEKISSSESSQIKELFKHSMPTILKSDAICRYFYFQKGDILKVTRRNKTIVYRIVK